MNIENGEEEIKKEDPVTVIEKPAEVAKEPLEIQKIVNFIKEWEETLQKISSVQEIAQGWDKLGEAGILYTRQEELNDLLLKRVIVLSRRDKTDINVWDIVHYYHKLKALAKCSKNIVVPEPVSKLALPLIVDDLKREGVIKSPDPALNQKYTLNPAAVKSDGYTFLFPRIFIEEGKGGYSITGLDIYDDETEKLVRSYPLAFDPSLHLKGTEFEGNKLYRAEDPRGFIHDGRLYLYFKMVHMTDRKRLPDGTLQNDQQMWADWRSWSATASISLNDLKDSITGDFKEEDFEWTYHPGMELIRDLEIDGRLQNVQNGLYWGEVEIDGRKMHAAAFRPTDVVDTRSADRHVYMAVSDNFEGPYRLHEKLYSPRRPEGDDAGLSFDDGYVGTTDSPVKTEVGWVNIYHTAVETKDGVIYRLGIMIMDLNDPSKIIYRSWVPLLYPAEQAEFSGWVGNVVYLSGFTYDIGIDKKLTIDMYYGTADTHIAKGKVTIDLNNLDEEKLKSLEQKELQELRSAQIWFEKRAGLSAY